MAQENRVDLQTTVDTNLASGINIPIVDHRAVETNLIDSNFNILDDYETGTFTITLTDLGGGATYTIGGGTNGIYRRFLDMVWIEISTTLTIATIGAASGLLRLDGLPFTQVGTSYVNVGTFLTTNITFHSIHGTVSGTNIFFRIQTGAEDGVFSSASSVNFVFGQIQISGFYRI